MIINATHEDIQKALDTANKEFDNNLEFNNFQRLSDMRHRVTLRVKSSKGKGARLGFSRTNKGNRRHLINACWHAHGTFFDSLPTDTRIQTAGVVTYPGESWQDRNIGSIIEPLYFSEACDC